MRALKINLEQFCSFSLRDFPDYNGNNFRQTISRLKKLDLIETEVRSSIAFYKIKGVKLPGDHRRVTFEGMGVGTTMIPILRMLKNQPPAIHDIKIQFNSADLHKFLKKHRPVNPRNDCIVVTRHLGDLINAKILIYPGVVQIDLSCTYKPFLYDIGSALALVMQMGRLYDHLLFLTLYEANDIPNPLKWIVTHYHFGIDGKEGYSGEKYERTFEDVAGGFIRFYSKTMPGGKVIPRLEQICTPHHALEEQLDQMIKQELNSLEM